MAIKSSVPMVFFLFCGAFFAPAASAAEDSPIYFGAQYANLDEGEFDLEPTAAVFRVGSDSEMGYSYELRLGSGLSTDKRTFSDLLPRDLTLELEIDSLVGLYLLYETDFEDGSVYGILGYTRIDFTLEADIASFSGNQSGDESDLSYGFGFNIGNSDKARFNLEYMQYLDRNEIEVSAISIGVLF